MQTLESVGQTGACLLTVLHSQPQLLAEHLQIGALPPVRNGSQVVHERAFRTYTIGKQLSVQPTACL
jgi:hypothetical protein